MEEAAVAEFLVRNHKPMTRSDARYFGLERNTPIQHEIWAAAGN
jgi:hypothetical protein